MNWWAVIVNYEELPGQRGNPWMPGKAAMGKWIMLAWGLTAGWGLTGLIRRLLLHCSLLDIPNQRSSHTAPTPRGGGLAIVVAFLSGLLALAMIGPEGAAGFPLLLFAAALPVAGVGLWDDLRSLSAGKRILVHLLAALLLVWGLGRQEVAGSAPGLVAGLGWPAAFLLALLVAWALNLFNFMDGIDGLAAGEAAFVAGSAAMLLAGRGGTAPEIQLLWLLAAACLGFLLWNWPPARIFLGDVGSGFLGFVLAALALRTAVFADLLPLACWLILPGVFLTDATVTLLRRMARGERWSQAHRSHAYQQAAARCGGHRPVTLAVMAINLFWLLPLSGLCVIVPRFAFPLIVLAYLPLLGLAVKYNAGGEISS